MADLMAVKTYALTDAAGKVYEIFRTAPGFAIGDMLHADHAKGAVDVTGQPVPKIGSVRVGSAFEAPAQTPKQLNHLARAHLAAGVSVVSKSHAEVTGTYPADPSSLSSMTLLAKAAEASKDPNERLRVYDAAGDVKLLTGQQIVSVLAAAEAHRDTLHAVLSGKATALPAAGPVTID